MKNNKKFSISFPQVKKILAIILLCCGFGVAGFGIELGIHTNKEGGVTVEIKQGLELSETQLPSLIESSEGTIETYEVPTVESVEGNQLINECTENETECGQGHYVYAPTDTYIEFKDYTYGKCWDVDSAWGAQCWDLAALFWMNYTNDGRTLSTCGTGAAYGAWECKEKNAGDEFEIINDATQLQAGDWLIFKGGNFGHVGMALGPFNNGYIALLGQNQGGSPCEGGGSSTNIINISTKNFLGAFRPKTYIKQEPIPDSIPLSNCIEWHVSEGDTMGKIMLECENTIVYGEPMNEYAKTWYSLLIKPGQSVYEGWQSETGVGLYYGDNIEHRIK